MSEPEKNKDKIMSFRQLNRFAIKTLFATLIIVKGLSAQTISPGPYQTLSGSRLWMEGRTNVSKFNCETQSLTGYAYFGIEDSLSPGANFKGVQNSETQLYLFITARDLNCGNKKMNRDMYAALKEEQFPLIEYELEKSELLTAPDSAGAWYLVRTIGRLTLAGTTKSIEMDIKIRLLPKNIFQIRAFTPVSMLDFSIKPPTAFLGLIKAKPELLVYFDIYAQADQTTGSVNHSQIMDHKLGSNR